MTVATPMIEVRGLGRCSPCTTRAAFACRCWRRSISTPPPATAWCWPARRAPAKSTLLRCLYGNYLATEGSIRVRAGDDWVELVGAPEQRILALRRDVIGYVSQFLRVIPRVSALDVVAEPLRMAGIDAGEARERAAAMLRRLNVPQRLWGLAPATFSGGEQQRVNIARGFIARHPILLLDEPTASLDPDNRAVVVALIREARAAGRCLLGIFHDEEVRDAVASRVLALRPAQAAVELE